MANIPDEAGTSRAENVVVNKVGFISHLFYVYILLCMKTILSFKMSNFKVDAVKA